MHFIYLTLGYSLTVQNIHTDLVDGLINQGHSVTVCRQDEARSFGPINLSYRQKACVLSIPTGKITKTGLIRKGINTLLLEHRFLKKLSKINFEHLDVVIYSTPPITFHKVITQFKKKYKCINYLLLKDIFPQNAVDLGMIRKNSLLYLYFRSKEKKNYKQADIIGCMSPENKVYLIKNNPELLKSETDIHIAPNCVFPSGIITETNKNEILDKYNIKRDTIHFIYGGNLGKPQGVGFIIKCINEIKNDDSIFLAIVGDGTEYKKLSNFLIDNKISNVKVLDFLPKSQYLELLSSMDFGLIFLDNKFTIPNFPSRVLDYMNASLPIVACTDIVCDIKQEICDQGAGFWCRSDDVESFKKIVINIKNNKSEIYSSMGKKSRELLIEKYSVPKVVESILMEINKINES